MAPIIPAILTAISSIPQIINAVKILKPVKEQVEKVEKDYTALTHSTTKDDNINKHTMVFEYLKEFLLPKIKKYGFDEYDIDTIIRFIVLFIRKIKKLRAYKER